MGNTTGILHHYLRIFLQMKILQKLYQRYLSIDNPHYQRTLLVFNSHCQCYFPVYNPR